MTLTKSLEEELTNQGLTLRVSLNGSRLSIYSPALKGYGTRPTLIITVVICSVGLVDVLHYYPGEEIHFADGRKSTTDYVAQTVKQISEKHGKQPKIMTP